MKSFFHALMFTVCSRDSRRVWLYVRGTQAKALFDKATEVCKSSSAQAEKPKKVHAHLPLARSHSYRQTFVGSDHCIIDHLVHMDGYVV